MKSYGKIPFHLLFVTDRNLSDKSLVSIVKTASANGLRSVQLREKDLQGGGLLKLAVSIRSATAKYKTKLIINDRLDIALLSGADGIHGPVNGMERSTAKKFAGKMIAGKSVHSLKDALKAEKDGFDYLLFGPVFRTPAKIKYGSPQGLNKLKEICNKVKVPVFAVGGITPARTKKCLMAGAHGVAVIRALMESKNIKLTLKQFENELGEL